MIIYQLHKTGGCWEDYYDCIMGSYLKKERAEEEKAKAEKEEQELRNQDEKCRECPYLYDIFITNEKLLEYCPNAKLESSDYGIDCANYYQLWEESSFEIREAEVEE